MREKIFTMRLSVEERARLEAVAAHYGLTAAEVIRMLAKRECDAMALKEKEREAKGYSDAYDAALARHMKKEPPQ